MRSQLDWQLVLLGEVVEIHRLYFQFLFDYVRHVLLTILWFNIVLLTEMQNSIHVTHPMLANYCLNQLAELRLGHKLY